MVPAPSLDAASTRLAFCERSTDLGGVDGAWWPGSADLGSELPDLISVLRAHVGDIKRVVYDPREWRSVPTRIVRRNTVVALDPYRMVDSRTIYLVGTHSRDAVLYVVPPSSAESVVAHVLAVVGRSTTPLTAAGVRHAFDEGAEARLEQRR